MQAGTRVKLKPLFAFDNDKVNKVGTVVETTGSFVVVKVDVTDVHICPYTVKRESDLEIIYNPSEAT